MEGVENDTIYITQEASAPYVTISQAEFSFDANGNTTAELIVYSNISWTIANTGSWINPDITSGAGTDTIQISVDPNPTIDERTAELTVASNELADIMISVTQEAGNPFIEVSTDELTIANTDGSTAAFTINSNTSWTVTSSETWLSLDIESGSDTGNVTITASENADDITRSATITVNDGNTELTITINQEAGDPYAIISVSELTIGSEAGSTAQFTISSNTEWSVSMSESWLSIDIPAGSDTATVTVTAHANSSAVTRTATITLSYGSGTYNISVIQDAGEGTAVDEISAVDVIVYPNPTYGIVTLETDISIDKMVLTDTKGTVIYPEFNDSQIDLSNLAAGTYFLLIYNNKTIVSKTIEVKK